MKKFNILLLALMLLTVFTITGCDWQQVLEELDKNPQKVIDKTEKERGPLEEESQMKDWAIMIYGSLDIEPQLEKALLQELLEITKLGNLDGKIHLLAQIDFRNAKYIPSKRYYIRKNELVVRGKMNNMNMGDPRTFEDFLNWSMQYPAKKRMLYILGHGTGWISVEGPGSIVENLRQNTRSSVNDAYDRLYPSSLYQTKEKMTRRGGRSFAYDHGSKDCLTLKEAGRVLDRVLHGDKIDILAFRSCLMNQLETAYEFSKHFNYMVASQTSQFGVAEGIMTTVMGVNNIGFDPTVLEYIKRSGSNISPRDLAREMFVSIKNTNKKIIDNVQDMAFSAQCLDLRALNRAVQPFKELSQLLKANLRNYDTRDFTLKLLTSSRDQAVKFGGLFEGIYTEDSGDSEYEYVDLGTFMRNMSFYDGMDSYKHGLLLSNIRDLSQAVRANLDRACIDKFSSALAFNGERSGGVTSIFMFPAKEKLTKIYFKLMEDKYRALDFNRETGWNTVLNEYYKDSIPTAEY